MSRLSLFPLTAEVSKQGHLIIGGCDTVELAAKFGTPLYLFDEFSLRSKCEAVVANKISEKGAGRVTIAGKFCESGDILVKDINLPPVSAGDIIAIPDCGAYCLPMASNYNNSLKPAIVLVKAGKARFIRRRETIDDLTKCDLV